MPEWKGWRLGVRGPLPEGGLTLARSPPAPYSRPPGSRDTALASTSLGPHRLGLGGDRAKGCSSVPVHSRLRRAAGSSLAHTLARSPYASQATLGPAASLRLLSGLPRLPPWPGPHPLAAGTTLAHMA